MNIEKLIESLQNAAGGPEGIKMCQAAAHRPLHATDRKREAAGRAGEGEAGERCGGGRPAQTLSCMEVGRPEKGGRP